MSQAPLAQHLECSSVLPNFLIVGAAKSGTTTLYDSLSQHPDIFMPDIKEPCYFSEGWPYWVTTEEEYRALFSGWRGQVAIGEASTTYLNDPEAPSRIKDLIGEECKILIILRNPADRAYSQWEHSYHHEGFETLSFEAALEAEDERAAHTEELKKLPYYHPKMLLYFRQGLYAGQVKRYFDTFRRENVLVLIFEEFIANPETHLERVYSFLGADPAFTPEFTNRNPPRASRLRALSNFLQSPPPLLNAAYQKLPGWLKQVVFRLARTIYRLNQRSRQKGSLDPELRTRLLKKYLQSIHELEDLLGRDLTIWYESLV